MSQKDFEPAGIGSDQIVLDFQHFGGGRNCQTSAMQRLMHHLGHDISEPMLVGISAGLGFIYWFMKMMTYPVIGGMNRSDCREFPGILGKAARRLGGDFEAIRTKSVKKAHLFLKETLLEDQPALVCVDMAYLDHLLTGEDDHFGEHNFLVFGIDEQRDLAYISDRFHGTTTMSLVQLQRARSSEFRPFPAMNQMVRFTLPEELTPLQNVIPSAIRENVKALLNPPISNFGIEGIKKWSKELGRYQKIIPDARNLAHALVMHYIYIETGGSGGAIFRQIYKDFLEEAGGLLENDGILRAAQDFERIVSTWRSIAEALLPDEFSALSELRRIQWRCNELMETEGLASIRKAGRLAAKVPALLDEAAASEVTHYGEFVPKVQELLETVAGLEEQALKELNGSVRG